jgi:hypothetical protein
LATVRQSGWRGKRADENDWTTDTDAEAAMLDERTALLLLLGLAQWSEKRTKRRTQIGASKQKLTIL